jgi:hypothetical protein
VAAAQLYCRARRYGDAEAQFNLAWMLTNARGIERDEAQAAHLFAAAAEQGLEQAQNMARAIGTPRGASPPCLRPPETDPPLATSVPQLAPTPARRPLPPPPNAPPQIVRFVTLVAPDFRLAPELVLAVMAAESNFDPLAVSPKNAQGLMQLTPDTAARFRVRPLTDPVQNIRGGMAYLRWLLAYFEGDLALVLAAYNAGERAVERYRGVPPYLERGFVSGIIAALGGQRSLCLRRPERARAPSSVLVCCAPPKATALRTARSSTPAFRASSRAARVSSRGLGKLRRREGVRRSGRGSCSLSHSMRSSHRRLKASDRLFVSGPEPRERRWSGGLSPTIAPWLRQK